MTKQYLAGFSDTVSDATVLGLLSSITSTSGTVDYSNVTFATTDVPDSAYTSPVWNVKVIKSSATAGTLIAQLVSYGGATPLAGGGTLYICSVLNSTKTAWARVASPTGNYVEIINPPYDSGRSRDDVVALAASSISLIPSVLFENTEAPGGYGALPYAVEIWKHGSTVTLLSHPTFSNETYTCIKENDAWSNWSKFVTTDGGAIGQLVTTTDGDVAALRGDGNDKKDDDVIISTGEDVAASTYLKLNYTNESGTYFALSAYKSGGSKELVGKSDGTLKWAGNNVITYGSWLSSSSITGITGMTISGASYAIKLAPNMYYIFMLLTGSISAGENKVTNGEFKIDGHSLDSYKWSCLAGNALNSDGNRFYPASAIAVNNQLYVTVYVASKEVRIGGIIIVD